jgi:hypothetical protein
MTIRFYPSRLPGEPLETHEHGVTSIRNWLVVNVEGYEDRDVPPLTVEVEGQSIPPGEWAICVIHPDSDVRLYPVPSGLRPRQLRGLVSVSPSQQRPIHCL